MEFIEKPYNYNELIEFVVKEVVVISTYQLEEWMDDSWYNLKFDDSDIDELICDVHNNIDEIQGMFKVR